MTCRWATMKTVKLALVAALAMTVSYTANANPTRSYEICVTNLTVGQPLTPMLAVAHGGHFNLFELGGTASLGLELLAETGDPSLLQQEVTGDHRVGATGVLLTDNGPGVPPVVLPGHESCFALEVPSGRKWMSFAMMLAATNDGFTGATRAKVANLRRGSSVELLTNAYDAGTEANDETAETVAALGGGSEQGGVGGEGFIFPHAGIQGIGDLIPAVHGWNNPVAKIVITRID